MVERYWLWVWRRTSITSEGEEGPEGKGGVGGVSAVLLLAVDSVELEWEDEAEAWLAMDAWF
jgi:hypothetical protein